MFPLQSEFQEIIGFNIFLVITIYELLFLKSQDYIQCFSQHLLSVLIN